jgi:hypothetical protein
MLINFNHSLEKKLVLLYWLTRIVLAIIWIWTAFVSWFVYPQAESIHWLQKLGLFYETRLFFSTACLLDFGLGIATIFYPSRRLWLGQLILVIFYSLTIAFGLPEFLWHPFGPLIKNLAVFVCLGYLIIIESHRKR